MHRLNSIPQDCVFILMVGLVEWEWKDKERVVPMNSKVLNQFQLS